MEQERPFVRLDPTLMLQLREIKRVTGFQIQNMLDKAVSHYIKNDLPPILETWGLTAKEIERISQLRYDQGPDKQKVPASSKKATA